MAATSGPVLRCAAPTRPRGGTSTDGASSASAFDRGCTGVGARTGAASWLVARLASVLARPRAAAGAAAVGLDLLDFSGGGVGAVSGGGMVPGPRTRFPPFLSRRGVFYH